MPDSIKYTDLDLELLHALQLSPRISWARLAAILNTDATTLSRRWSRLTQQGLAWLTCYPDFAHPLHAESGPTSALVEVECVAGLRQQVIDEISADPGAASIACTSGERELVLTVTMPGPGVADLDGYIDERIASITGVSATRTHFIRRYFVEGSQWRLRQLSPQQVAALRDRPHRTRRSTSPLTALEKGIVRLLGRDARLPVATIARELDVSESTVSRTIARLMTGGKVIFRCELAHSLMGWNVMTTLFLDVPPPDVPEVARAMTAHSEVRLCCSITSQANMAVTIWTHGFLGVDNVEEDLTRRFPRVRILDRYVTTRAAKRIGHILGKDGKHRGFVPLNITE